MPKNLEEMRTVYIVGGGRQYEEMYRKRNKWLMVDNIEDADLVQFTGGADVSPVLYGEAKLWHTQCNVDRDIYEVGIYKLAKSLGKPTVGICRGAQFLHVMNGGKLWQDVSGHLTTHPALCRPDDRLTDKQNTNLWTATKSVDGRFWVSSTHHQMMRIPDSGKGVVLLTSSIALAKRNDRGIIQCVLGQSVDVEAVWYPEARSLCYQPHPEMLDVGSACQVWYFSAIENLIFERENN